MTIVLIEQENYGERYSSLFVGVFSTRKAAEVYVQTDDDLKDDPNIYYVDVDAAINQ